MMDSLVQEYAEWSRGKNGVPKLRILDEEGFGGDSWLEVGVWGGYTHCVDLLLLVQLTSEERRELYAQAHLSARRFGSRFGQVAFRFKQFLTRLEPRDVVPTGPRGLWNVYRWWVIWPWIRLTDALGAMSARVETEATRTLCLKPGNRGVKTRRWLSETFPKSI